VGLAAVLVVGGIVFGWARADRDLRPAVIAPGQARRRFQRQEGCSIRPAGSSATCGSRMATTSRRAISWPRLDETQARTNLAIVTKALDEAGGAPGRATRPNADGRGQRSRFPAELLSAPQRSGCGPKWWRSETRLFEIRQAARAPGKRPSSWSRSIKLRPADPGQSRAGAGKGPRRIDWIQQELAGCARTVEAETWCRSAA